MYIHTHIHTCVYIYIYIHTHVFRTCSKHIQSRSIPTESCVAPSVRDTYTPSVRTHTFSAPRLRPRSWQPRHFANRREAGRPGAKDRTPELDALEVIVDVQWHFRMDVQWYSPTQFNFAVVFSKGLSLFPLDFNWTCPMDCQWHFPMECHMCDFWCVICCPELQSDDIT